MLKKSLIVGAGLLLLAGLFTFRYTRSHVMTAWEDGQQFLSEMESTRHQIRRAKHMIKQLDPEIKKCTESVAKAAVDVDHLRAQVDRVNDDLAGRKSDIMRLKGHLDDGGGTFYVGTVPYSEQQVKKDLTIRLAKYQTLDGHRSNLEQILEAREKGLDAAEKKLAEMRVAKGQLLVEVEALESRLELIEMKQVASDVRIDDSALSQTRELVESIKTRLDVADKMLNTDTDSQDLIPLDQESQAASEDISEQVARYFGENGDDHSDEIIDFAAAASK